MNRSNLSDSEKTKQRLIQIARIQAERAGGRPLEQLKKGKDTLQGAESMRLRTFCTSECMEPRRDLCDFGRLLMNGPYDLVVLDLGRRVQTKEATLGFEAAKAAVAQDLASMRWGPTRVPIFNLLLLFTLIRPENKEIYHTIAQFYIELGVPVDGCDLSGTTALSQSYSTKPSFDLAYAQMLYDAGAHVNARNRYGATAAHEIVTIWTQTPENVRKAAAALDWFLSHGGNIDIADGDGITPRSAVQRLKIPALIKVVNAEDEKRKINADKKCACCGRDESELLACSKCKKTKYCDPKTRPCQALDLPKHKMECHGRKK